MGGGHVLADRPTAAVFSDDALLEAGHLERPLGMLPCPVCGAGPEGGGSAPSGGAAARHT
jgi:hypothetical protein